MPPTVSSAAFPVLPRLDRELSPTCTTFLLGQLVVDEDLAVGQGAEVAIDDVELQGAVDRVGRDALQRGHVAGVAALLQPRTLLRRQHAVAGLWTASAAQWQGSA